MKPRQKDISTVLMSLSPQDRARVHDRAVRHALKTAKARSTNTRRGTGRSGATK